VIVRISNDGEYELPEDLIAQVNEIDNEAVAAVEAGDEARFHELFNRLIEMVESGGSPIPPEDLAVAQVIVPPRDLTFEEAKVEFTGEGIIPD
jgi:hypothetical protein